MKIVVALENIRSLQNIGAIFRTCSFFGVKKVLLVGYSGKTIDTKNRKILHPKILKSSLGSENDITIELIEDSEALIKYSEEHSCALLAVEQHKESVNLKNLTLDGNATYIIVFGNEVDGVSSSVLNVSKKIIEIERKGTHNSLNVATSVGIVLYALDL